jgi:hypothetical protein
VRLVLLAAILPPRAEKKNPIWTEWNQGMLGGETGLVVSFEILGQLPSKYRNALGLASYASKRFYLNQFVFPCGSCVIKNSDS